MDRREGAGRYKAMQSIMDWDRSRLVYRAGKRSFDIVFSGAVLVVIAIPSLVLAALIRLESDGSPFYSQIRVGQTRPDGSLTTFRMWKFRSMYKDADERLAELKGQNEIAGAMFKMR
ncbi:sugar transferase, partial [Collinsella aerofaciens]|nr:sugar transferase [Collinsella aerofaciens]